ncbi:hypothetical protein [Plantactinospora soyae]|uniref:Uncharacterized protein n=1 Tax=Plantactinospora soyae TaxID=1544732 RepID=A0A927R622_9ACTN|nr:hypothetical protein [Plantactinospora soyae]MBE1486436.1 hypothetical protein [Plantactinospora soyae]
MTISDESSAGVATLAIEHAAREATARLAPDELQLFDDITAAWRQGRLAYQGRPHRPAGGSVGFGVDFSLVGELVYAVVCTATADVLGTLATDRLRQRRWWRRRAAGPPDDRHIVLRDCDVGLLWAACRRHGIAFGLTETQAEVLADTVRDAVRRPQDPS